MVGNGAQLLLTSSISNPAVSQPITVSSVAIRTTVTAESPITGTSGQLSWRFRAANNMTIYAGAFLGSTTATDNQWHAFQGVINNASSDDNIDGVSNTGTAGTNTISFSATVGLSIFQDIFGVFLTGQIEEVGYWNSAFTPTNSTAMCHNQFTYFGTSVSC